MAHRSAGELAAGEAVAQEQDEFDSFLCRHELVWGPDAVALYLTHRLDDDHPSGTSLRTRLRLLDKASILQGLDPPSRDRHLRLYLRGMHREAALGPVRNRTPLYLEDVLALVDVISEQQLGQRRDVALLLLANALPLSSVALAELEWQHVRFTRGGVRITVPQRHGRHGLRGVVTLDRAQDPEAVSALAALRRARGPGEGPVFATRAGDRPNLVTISRIVRTLPGRGKPWSHGVVPIDVTTLGAQLEQLRQPRPWQLRDRALLLLAFFGCLTGVEASALRVPHIDVREEGLLLSVPGRRRRVALPIRPDAVSCPLRAWRAWQETTAAHAPVPAPERPAFPDMRLGQDWTRPAAPPTLSRIVKEHAAASSLRGPYSFSSLRIGFIRTAARAGVPIHLVYEQAGVRSLASVELHYGRERLLQHNLIDHLGL